MKTEEILKMEAGREMDALVGENPMGLIPCDKWEYCNLGSMGGPALRKMCGHNNCYPTQEIPVMGGKVGGCPEYSTDISAAFEVVEKLDSCLYLKEHGRDGTWEAFFCGANETAWIGRGETAPLAICRAALLVMMEKK